MTNGNDVFQLQEGSRWNRGLNNLFRAEFGRWFGTKMWWAQIIIWAAIIDLILIPIALDGGEGGDLVTLFNIFLGVFAAIGACIIMQGTIVGEKQSGTAAWVLSKPVARQAFILAKLCANSIGIAITIVLAQGLIAYVIIALATELTLAPLAYLGGLGVQSVNLFFYITLTLMLGAFFDRRGAVIAIPLVFLFAQQFLIGLAPSLEWVLPWTLAIPSIDQRYSSIATAVMTGTEPLSYLPVITTLCASGLFILITLSAFAREEF
jgi:ABC-2 type transport system permease protein